MELNTLTAISPIDGRYRNKTANLAPYFSEFGLIKGRILVEIEYFIALCEIPLPQLQYFDVHTFPDLRAIYKNFSEKDAHTIKKLEKETNHDVKAVEYFIKTKFDALGLADYKEFIHFGLTSQDINNTAVPYLLKEGLDQIFQPSLEKLMQTLEAQAQAWKAIALLARTHGQPASPTSLGKEWQVFFERLHQQKAYFKDIPYAAKFGGATGNFNAHHVAYPHVDWPDFANHFVNRKLGLKRSHPTTQIEHYDHMAALFDNFKRINTILLDLCKDVWQYISVGYFKQKIQEGEVGSSAMPHKVNPIDFENAEGNLGIANANLEHLAAKLPVSRLQRDLTDSTVLRNIGVPMAHTQIALQSIQKGLEKLEVNEPAINKDLEDNLVVVSEGIQTILRREGYKEPYETLKALTRNNEKITRQKLDAFIDTLSVTDEVKKELKNITPFNYTGTGF